MDECVLRPSGDLDLATADAVLNEWLTVVDRDRPECVIVDLSDVTFVDSSGLRMLFLLRRRVVDNQGVCRIRGASAHQRKLLDISGLAPLFPEADRPAGAVTPAPVARRRVGGTTPDRGA